MEPVTNVLTAAHGDKLPSAVVQNTNAFRYQPRNAANPAMNVNTTTIVTPGELPAAEAPNAITIPAVSVQAVLIIRTVMSPVNPATTAALQPTPAANAQAAPQNQNRITNFGAVTKAVIAAATAVNPAGPDIPVAAAKYLHAKMPAAAHPSNIASMI